MLSKEEILAKGKACNFEIVNIDGFGEVGIREITAGQRDKLEAAGARGVKNPDSMQDFRARFVAVGLCDAKGERIFNDGDIGAISSMNSTVIDAIFTEILRFNRMGRDEVGEAEKN